MHFKIRKKEKRFYFIFLSDLFYGVRMLREGIYAEVYMLGSNHEIVKNPTKNYDTAIW